MICKQRRGNRNPQVAQTCHLRPPTLHAVTPPGAPGDTNAALNSSCPRGRRWSQSTEFLQVQRVALHTAFALLNLQDSGSSTQNSSYLPATLTPLGTSLPSWVWPQRPLVATQGPSHRDGPSPSPAQVWLFAQLSSSAGSHPGCCSPNPPPGEWMIPPTESHTSFVPRVPQF